MKNVTRHIHAHEEPCLAIRLERESPDDGDETEQKTAEEMLIAVEALTSGWMEPLALHLSIGCYDTETLYAPDGCQPHRPEWFLRREDLPPGVEARHIYADPVVSVTSMFISDGIRSWIAYAMMQECPDAPRFIPSWRGLWWTAVRVKIPEPLCVVGCDELLVDCYAGTIPIPLERANGGVWVSGPLERYTIGPPVDLVALNRDGSVTIDLNVYWGLWLQDPAGRAQVDAAIERVLALGRGWRRSAG